MLNCSLYSSTDVDVGEAVCCSVAVLLQVSVYQPNEGHGVVVTDRPPSPDDEMLKTFAYGSMPEKYYKKYQYATR